jgi:hypothetical protein
MFDTFDEMDNHNRVEIEYQQRMDYKYERLRQDAKCLMDNGLRHRDAEVMLGDSQLLRKLRGIRNALRDGN